MLLFSFSILCFLGYSMLLFSNKMIIFEFEIFNILSISFTFTMILDKISLSFSMIVTLISSCVFMFSTKYMEEDEFYWRFTWILLSFVISMNFLIFSGSLFFLLLGWDGLGITSFALIIYYQSKESLTAGFQTLLINRIGDVIIVCSSFLYVTLTQFSYTTLPLNMSLLIFILCLAGLTKSAQFPFSSWLPAAMAAPTPVSALVHSSTLVTAGIYMIIRFSSTLSLSESSSSVLLFCGAITCFLGGTAAIFENDLKKIVALSTLSQLGVMVFCLGLGLPMLSLFHLYTHALFKALLFLAAGTMLMSSFGNQDIRILGSLGLSMPLCTMMFNISSLCLIGAPFMSAFFSKHLILEKMLMSNINIFSLFMMLFATCSTALYVIRSLKAVCWYKPSLTVISISNSTSIYIPMIVLGLCSIFFGQVYKMLDYSLLEIVFISNFSSTLINMVTLTGLWLGFIFLGRLKSFIFSSLFFMTPMYSFSVKLLSPMNKAMETLDYGWLEIAPKMSFIVNFFNKYMHVFNWPNFLSFNRVSWILFIIMIATYINF
uniref:NADH-ubiquinone oxidoreductase chain 5 n=1 Tax=Pseudosuccinea columella TaxID=31228 RepID=A0A4P8Y3J9_PSECM|nr:NADH dehydrogenase subunit 5 [Pseudosuccinea columella]QCT09594.1 NADH dehydrogenase subunit 5 [Pseudosuccinea columella]